MTESTLSTWQQLAGNTGGTVGGLATALGHGQSVVFAATSVGVYRSSDGGRTWLLPGVRTTIPFAEVVEPSARFAQDRTIFMCAGDGLYRSTDAGESWQPVLVGSRMLSVASAASDAGASLLLAATETDGVLRSEDLGTTWTGANAGLLDVTAIALALSPRFAADRTGFVGTASGLYRTRNGARSWRAVETDLTDPAVQCIAVSPAFAEDRLVLAGTEADGLLRSDDAGATWSRPPALMNQGVTALAFCTRYSSKPTIAAAIESGIALSDDGGRTWRPATGTPPPGLVLSLMFVATDQGEALLAGLHRQGIARSDDDGAHWEMANHGLNARLLTGLALSPDFAHDRTLFAVGPQDGLSASTDGGHTWADRTNGLGDQAILGLAISPAYATDRTLYAATAAGIHVSRDAAATWALSPGAAQPARTVAAMPAACSGPPTVIAALVGGKLLASDDRGTTWRACGAIVEGAEINLVVLSPTYARDRTVFVATTQPGSGERGDMVLWRSTDGGGYWDRWLVQRDVDGAIAQQSFMGLAVSPTYAVDERVFAGLGARVVKPLAHARQVRAGRKRPVWRGADLGGGAASVTFVALSPDFGRDNTLFAATNAGVFVSRDAAETFQPWSEGLVPPATVAVVPSPAYHTDRHIYALGLGGTIWRRADRI